MAPTNVDDGLGKLERGKEIDWEKVIPSISRPVWEPPALEVLDAFEHMPIDEIKRAIPDPAARSRFLDLYGELTTLTTYLGWACSTCLAAIEVSDQEKMSYYLGLVETVKAELKDVYIEWRAFSAEVRGLTVDAGPHLAKPYVIFDRMLGLHADVDSTGSETHSTTSYGTVRDDIPNPGEELGDLIDLNSNDDEDGDDINAICTSTGVSELIGVDRGPLPVVKHTMVSLPLKRTSTSQITENRKQCNIL